MENLITYKKVLAFGLCCALIALGMHSGSATSLSGTVPDVELPDPIITSRMPEEVAFGAGVQSAETARPFFDYFSWQSFVALNWPAAKGADGKAVRGVADPNSAVSIGSAGTRVWESYKTDWELFRPGGAAPTPWESYDLPPGSTNPCGNVGDSKMLEMFTKMDSVIDGINQAFSGPLVDQSRNYVRYEIHINKPFYEKVANPAVKWYLVNMQSKDPTKPNIFPDGVIEIKASWKELVDGRDDPGRYYTVNTLIVEPGNPPSCRPAKMGLIGLHIANKVKHFREWVWSTFEQVDNLPEVGSSTGHPFSLNNGTAKPASPGGFDRQPGSLPKTATLPQVNDPARDPIQVTRLTPISAPGQVGPSTDQINLQWQQALSGSVWQFYKLVATQWPEVQDGANFKPRKIGKLPLNADTPFPAKNVANTTMETYVQDDNCMACHYRASQEDFSFLLSLRAFRPPPPLSPSLSLMERAKRITDDRINSSETLRSLREVMKEHDKRNLRRQ